MVFCFFKLWCFKLEFKAKVLTNKYFCSIVFVMEKKKETGIIDADEEQARRLDSERRDKAPIDEIIVCE